MELRDAVRRLGFRNMELHDAVRRLGFRNMDLRDAVRRLGFRNMELRDAVRRCGFRNIELHDKDSFAASTATPPTNSVHPPIDHAQRIRPKQRVEKNPEREGGSHSRCAARCRL